MLISDNKIEFSSNFTLLALESTWSEVNEHFLDWESREFKEPAECEVFFMMTKGLRPLWLYAFAGRILMDFLGKKSAKNLG